jgi:hypothetical protein
VRKRNTAKKAKALLLARRVNGVQPLVPINWCLPSGWRLNAQPAKEELVVAAEVNAEGPEIGRLGGIPRVELNHRVAVKAAVRKKQRCREKRNRSVALPQNIRTRQERDGICPGDMLNLAE